MQSSPASYEGQTRGERLVARGGKTLMPEIPRAAQYMISDWAELGYCQWNGDQPGKFSSIELQSWSQMSCKKLSPWEFRVLRSMSREFGFEVLQAREEGAPAPFGDPEMQIDRSLVAQGLSAMLKSRTSKRKRP